MAKIVVKNNFFEFQARMGETQSEPAIFRLCKSNALPVKVSYWLSRIIGVLPDIANKYNENKQRLILKWCDKDEEGNPKTFENGQVIFTKNAEEFNKDLSELLNIENELQFDKVVINVDDIPVGVINVFDFSELEIFIEFQNQ